jgi:amino acid transporter
MLFTYTIYTFYFVLLYNTATNSMQFANQVIISATVPTSVRDPDQRLLRFVAVVALTFFSLLHYFSARAGRALNQVFAFTKVVMLVIVLIAGMVKAGTTFEADWSKKPSTDASSAATAYLLIAFSFAGWENATFVSTGTR